MSCVMHDYTREGVGKNDTQTAGLQAYVGHHVQVRHAFRRENGIVVLQPPAILYAHRVVRV